MAQKNSKIIEIKSENPEKNTGIIQENKRGRGRPRKETTALTESNQNNTLSVVDKKQQKALDDYFSTHEVSCTFAGVAKILGYKCANDFIQEAKKNNSDKYLTYALLKVEERYEKGLFGKNPSGAIFALKQIGWNDTQKIETEVKAVSVNISLGATLDDLTKKLMPVMEAMD